MNKSLREPNTFNLALTSDVRAGVGSKARDWAPVLEAQALRMLGQSQISRIGPGRARLA